MELKDNFKNMINLVDGAEKDVLTESKKRKRVLKEGARMPGFWVNLANADEMLAGEFSKTMEGARHHAISMAKTMEPGDKLWIEEEEGEQYPDEDVSFEPRSRFESKMSEVEKGKLSLSESEFGYNLNQVAGALTQISEDKLATDNKSEAYLLHTIAESLKALSKTGGSVHATTQDMFESLNEESLKLETGYTAKEAWRIAEDALTTYGAFED